jgi:hypothetical protein
MIALEVGKRYKNNLGNVCEILWSDENNNYFVGRYEGAFQPIVLTKRGGLASWSKDRRVRNDMIWLIEEIS